MMDIDIYFEIALSTVKKAGELVNQRISSHKNVELKSCDIDLVTETDQEVEKLIINDLHIQFAEHKFIGEENSADGTKCNLTNDPTWIIDPIDGTLNFVHSFPHSCISLALFINAEPVIGIIYNPMLNQLFTAKKGNGAYLNGKQIFVSKQTDLSKALVMMENGTSRDPERMKVVTENLLKFIPKVHGIRSLGSAALDIAMVACGAADAYYECGVHIWDMAAGVLIVNEAGGCTLDPAGEPIDYLSRRVLCASSKELAQAMTKNLTQFYPMPRD